MVILQSPTKFISGGGGGGGGGNTPAIGQAISFVLRFFPFVLRILGQCGSHSVGGVEKLEMTVAKPQEGER